MRRRLSHRIKEIGGEGALDYQLYLVLVSFSFVSSIAMHANLQDLGSVWNLTLSNIFAFTMLAPILVGTNRWLTRGGRQLRLSLWFLLVFGATLGLLKGAGAATGMYLLGEEVNLIQALGERVWQTTLVGLWASPVIALLGTQRARYSKEREQLIAERVAQQSSLVKDHDQIAEFIEGTKRKLRENPGQDRTSLAVELRRIIQEDLRPLSHQIWKRESDRIPSFKALDLVKLGLRSDVYRLTFAVPLFFLAALIPTISFFGAEDGWTVHLFRTLWFGVLLYLFGRHQTLGLRDSVAKYLVFLLLVTLGFESIGFLIGGNSFSVVDLAQVFVYLIWVAELTLLTGAGWAFVTFGQRVEIELGKVLSQQSQSDLAWTQQRMLRDRQLAQFLHGHLQSKLVTTALRLEQEGREQPLEQDLEFIEQVLEETLAQFRNQDLSDLSDVAVKLEQNWAGLIQLGFDLTDRKVPSHLLTVISEVFNEGISNSVRHGFASTVAISLKEDGGKFVITLQDNGTGPRSGSRGLGSHYFDSVSESWSLEPSGEGALLRVVLAA